MYHPQAAARIARDLPDVKLVVLVRDPVERAYSQHAHEVARGFETERDFGGALALEPARLRRQEERLAADPDVLQLRPPAPRLPRPRRVRRATSARWPQHVGRDRIHVVESERFFAEPGAGLRRGAGLPRPAADLERTRRSSGTTPARAPPTWTRRIRRELAEHYAPHDERLATWLGRTPARGAAVTAVRPYRAADMAPPDSDRRSRAACCAARGARRAGQHGRARRWPASPASRSPGSWRAALGTAAGRRVLRRDRRVRAGRRRGASSARRPAWSTGRPGCAPPAAPTCLGACLRAGAGPGARSPRWSLAAGMWSARRDRPPGRGRRAGYAEPAAGARGVPAVGRRSPTRCSPPPAAFGRCARPCCSTGSSAARCSCCWWRAVGVTGTVADRRRCRRSRWPGRRRTCRSAVLAGVALRRLSPGIGGPPRLRSADDFAAPATSGGSPAPRALASVAQLALQRVDVLLVAALAGLAPAAVYAVAGRFVVLGQFANQGDLPVGPAPAGRSAGRRRPGRPPTALPDGDRLAGARHLADAPAGDRSSPGSTSALFGDGYQRGAHVVVVLAGRDAGGDRLRHGRHGPRDGRAAPRGTSSTCWLALAVMVGLDVLLIPRLGALGAAIGLAVRRARQQPAAAGPGRSRARPAPVRPGHRWPRAAALGCFGVFRALLAAAPVLPRPGLRRDLRRLGGGCVAAAPAGAARCVRRARSERGNRCAPTTPRSSRTPGGREVRDVVYAPDSYASAVNGRQRALPAPAGPPRVPDRAPGAARLRLRHRPGDPAAARAGPGGARLRHVGRRCSRRPPRSARTRSCTRSPADGPVPAPADSGRPGPGDRVPAAAQRRRGRPRPGDRVRREGRCPTPTSGLLVVENHGNALVAAAPAAPRRHARRTLVRRAVATREVERAARPARLRDRRAARLRAVPRRRVPPRLAAPGRPARGRPRRPQRPPVGRRHRRAVRGAADPK